VNACYLLIFVPVLIIGAAIGWGGCWWARGWKAASTPAPYLPTAKANDALRCGCGDCLAAKPVNDIEWARLTRACWQGDSQ
jgi:hypothetical protein